MMKRLAREATHTDTPLCRIKIDIIALSPALMQNVAVYDTRNDMSYHVIRLVALITSSTQLHISSIHTTNEV